MAAAFALAVLSVVAEMAEASEREDFQKVVREVIAECNGILADDCVYILDDFEDRENSELLRTAINKALEAVTHAGNLCNNSVILFSGNIQELMMQVRDRCDLIIKRRLFGIC
ncbi:MAG: hypothetical protein WAV16_00450 [Candidatus Moraniibacteriota bacterium]